MLIASFRSGDFEISVYNSLKEDLNEKWDAMQPESLSSDYLCLIKETKPPDLDFRYVIVEKKIAGINEVCAIIYFQLLNFTKQNINFRNSIFLNLLTGILLKLRPFKILLCGNFFAVNFPAIRYKKEKINRRELLELLADIEKYEKHDVFILKDLDDEFTESEMSVLNWTKYTTDLTMAMVIDPTWVTIEDYYQALAKKYKKRSERIIAAGKKMIRKQLNADEIEEQNDYIMKLFNQVSSKQTIKMGLIGPDYFYKFKAGFPDTFSFVGYYVDEKLIAFASYFEHGKTLEIHYIGIDYAFNNDYMIYFNILFDGVEKAIAERKHELELGRTAREAKANLGGKPVYFNDYIRIKGRLPVMLSKLIGRYFMSEIGELWTDRHPFRR